MSEQFPTIAALAPRLRAELADGRGTAAAPARGGLRPLAADLEAARAEHQAGTTSWAPTDLGPVLAGSAKRPEPTRLTRADGSCLLYAGAIHDVHGEPETGKSWIAAAACREELLAGGLVAYIDFETSVEVLVGRLRALGVADDVIGSGLLYLRPEEPLDGRAREEFNGVVARRPALAVIDGQTEGYSQQGLDPYDNRDAAKWLDLVARPLSAGGATVLGVDHVVKDRERRGRFAIGAQHKLAGIDVSFSVKAIEPFAPGHDGHVRLTVEKDRHGGVRRHAAAGTVAEVHLRSLENGRVDVVLAPPEQAPAGPFRPTHLMERISRAVEDDPGATKNGVRAVKGNNNAKDVALRLLITDGYVRIEPDGPAIRHYSARPYREADDPNHAQAPAGASRTTVPTVPMPCPDHAQGTVGTDHAHHAPRPTSRRGMGHGPEATSNDQTMPTARLAELEAIVERNSDLFEHGEGGRPTEDPGSA